MRLQCAVIGVYWILSLFPDLPGASYLHSLPIYDGCASMKDSELSVVVLEAEPVLLRCFELDDLIDQLQLTPENGYTFHISHSNPRGAVARGNRGRVRRERRSLWLLPSQPSDSGIYTCVVRNETFCVKSNVSLTVYPAGRPNMEMMSYLLDPVMAGHDVIIPCPTDHFNRTGNPHWYKDRSVAVLPVGRGRYHSYPEDTREFLKISHFSASDSGFYTCRVTVSVFSSVYTVSRSSRVHVTGEAAPTFQPASTYTPEVVDASPRILTPANNSVFESHFGSSLVIRCTVATSSQLMSSTQVTWLVDDQSVEESSLAARAFQEERRVIDGQVEADLIILEVKEEDSGAEIRCVTQNSAGSQEVFVLIQMADEGHVWLLVAALCSSCCVCVVCAFLYHLLRPCKLKQRDYFLTRQDSVF